MFNLSRASNYAKRHAINEKLEEEKRVFSVVYLVHGSPYTTVGEALPVLEKVQVSDIERAMEDIMYFPNAECGWEEEFDSIERHPYLENLYMEIEKKADFTHCFKNRDRKKKKTHFF